MENEADYETAETPSTKNFGQILPHSPSAAVTKRDVRVAKRRHSMLVV